MLESREAFQGHSVLHTRCLKNSAAKSSITLAYDAIVYNGVDGSIRAPAAHHIFFS